MARGASILLIDDDRELCVLLVEFLEKSGYRARVANDGPLGLRMALEEVDDLVILDVMLPGLDGFAVLESLRKQSDTPVLMLTARSETPSRVAGLNAGADDYLPKPFEPDELLARVRALHRRSKSGAGRTAAVPLVVSGVTLNPLARQVYHCGREVSLTTLEFEILEMLMRSAGRVVSRNQIFLRLFQREASFLDRSLDVHVSHLRQKLGDDSGLIQTVRGVGYQFVDRQGASH